MEYITGKTITFTPRSTAFSDVGTSLTVVGKECLILKGSTRTVVVHLTTNEDRVLLISALKGPHNPNSIDIGPRIQIGPYLGRGLTIRSDSRGITLSVGDVAVFIENNDVESIVELLM